MPEDMPIDEEVEQLRDAIDSFEERFHDSSMGELRTLEKLLDEAEELENKDWSERAKEKTKGYRTFHLGRVKEQIAYEIIGMDPDNLMAFSTLAEVYDKQDVSDFWVMERYAELHPEHPLADAVAQIYERNYQQNRNLYFLERTVKFYRLFIEVEEKRIEEYKSKPTYMPSGSSLKREEIFALYKKKVEEYSIELHAMARGIIFSSQKLH